jgi:threonine/homoserine/homoserine lactone efflux protein
MAMELLLAITAIAEAILIGAMSPGPSFILVASTAVAVSRRHRADEGGSVPC